MITGSNLVGTSKWGCGGTVDARDLKSLGSNTVRVQIPPSPPLIFIYAPIAQLDRAFDYGSKGCGFDSYWARHYLFNLRDVAQLGSALDLGSRGRRFKSCHPDHLIGTCKKHGEVA